MDSKPGLSSQTPKSEEPTLAPSRASASDDGKASAAGEQTDLDVGTAEPTEKQSHNNEKQEESQEKPDTIVKVATATSATGSKLQQTTTREDGTEYPKGVMLGLIILALCLSVFTMALGMLAIINSGERRKCC